MLNLQSSSRWLLAFLSFQTLLVAVTAEDILKISSFQECLKNAEIFINNVDVTYDASTRSVDFKVEGTSTKSQNVTAVMKVEAYGKDVYTKTFNPCDTETFVAGLCPVPVGQFGGASKQQIPEEYASQIPNIAFSIPDIALQATIELRRLEDDKEVGCVVADLQNGKSLDSSAITYAAAGIVAAALLISAASSLVGGIQGSGEPGEYTGSTPGFTAIIGWFQAIATSGMLSVNYAPLYRSFTERFGFSTGLITWTQMQETIDNFRAKTGGNITENNIANVKNATSNLMARQFGVNGTSTDSGAGTPINPNITRALGIEKFVEESGIVQENAFMTVFLIACIIILIIVVSILLFKCILEAWALFGNFPKSLTTFRKRYWGTIFRTVVQFINISFPIFVLYSIYQFKTGDSWAATLLAAVTLAAFTGVLLFFVVRICLFARKHIKIEGSAARLFEDKAAWLKYSIFYNTLNKKQWWFFAPILVYSFVRSALIAVLNGKGLAQTISVLIVEILMLCLFVYARPYAHRAENIVTFMIHVVKVLQMGAILVFVDQLKVERSTQTIMGFALVIMTSVLTVLLVGLMLFHAIYACCKDNPHRKRRKEAEKLRRESEFFLAPGNHDTSYRASDHMEHGRVSPYDPAKIPLSSVRPM